MPHKLLDLHNLIGTWQSILMDTSKQTAFGWVAAVCAAVAMKIAEYSDAYAEYIADKTHEKRLAKDNKKKAMLAAMRAFANSSIRFNDKMTEADKLVMGIRPRDTVSTPVPAPDIQPETDAVPSGSRRHTVTAINPQTQTKKRPPFVKGVAFASKLRLPSEPKAAAKEMPSVFRKDTVIDFTWEEADIGKVADYATAYENEGTERGTWSNVVSVVVA
jgi:hypothetical protein